MRCVFCTNPSRVGAVVFENDHASVVLHDDWSPRGHAMIVAKKHIQNVEEADAGFFEVWKKAERVILEATGRERAMILKLGIVVPHLHVHIYPMSADATRQNVFDAFDGKATEARDEGFIENVRLTLASG